MIRSKTSDLNLRPGLKTLSPLAGLLLGLGLACIGVNAHAQPSAQDSEHAAAQAQAVNARARAQQQSEQARAMAAEAQQQALLEAENQQEQALRAVESARQQLEAQTLSRKAGLERQQEKLQQNGRETSEVQRALEQAHESLRKASREVARVHRELEREQSQKRRGQYRLETLSGSDRRQDAFIGVVLGREIDGGVEVLGVSPDGPAERAGIQPGDVIVAVMGEALDDEDAVPAMTLRTVMAGVEVDDPLDLELLRDGAELQVTVVAARRKPFSWHSFSRLSSDGDDRDVHIAVERIEIPKVDSGELHEELERARTIIEQRGQALLDSESGELFEFHDFSELGQELMGGSGIWFGMSMARGLKMTALNPELAEYFATDRGVLVLSAAGDNPLNLKAGDVILEIEGQQVSSAADVMRFLRQHDSGEEIALNIVRQQQAMELTVKVPENRLGLNAVPWLEALVPLAQTDETLIITLP